MLGYLIFAAGSWFDIWNQLSDNTMSSTQNGVKAGAAVVVFLALWTRKAVAILGAIALACVALVGVYKMDWFKDTTITTVDPEEAALVMEYTPPVVFGT